MYLFMLQVFVTLGWIKGHCLLVGLHTVGHVANCMTQHVVCINYCRYVAAISILWTSAGDHAWITAEHTQSPGQSAAAVCLPPGLSPLLPHLNPAT